MQVQALSLANPKPVPCQHEQQHINALARQTPHRLSTGTVPTRGFKAAWSTEQWQQIKSLLRSKGAPSQQQQPHHHHQNTPPETSSDSNETPVGGKETPPEEAAEANGNGNLGDGSNASEGGVGSCTPPNFLSDDEIAALGAPRGDDIDPAMTAIFKVRPLPALHNCT